MSGKKYGRSNSYGQTETTFENNTRRRKSFLWKLFWFICMLLIISWLWYRLFNKDLKIEGDKKLENKTENILEKETILLDGLFYKTPQKEFEKIIDENFEWKNLPENIKNEIFNSNFNFQGENKKFIEIFPENSQFYESLSHNELKSILKGENFVINELKSDPNNFYIDRKFINRSAELFSMSLDYFTQKFTITPNSVDIYDFKDLKNLKVLLLADKFGSGKTATLRNIEKVLRKKGRSWMNFIDLKTHQNFLDIELNNKDDVREYLIDILIITKKSSKSAFNHFFNQNRVTLLWDGIHEENLNKSLELFEKINNLTECQQIIATRPQFMNKIESTFNITAFKFFPFNEDDRKSFISKILQTSNLNEDEKSEIQLKILKFISKMNSKGKTSEDKNIDSLIMLEMITNAALKNDKGFNFDNSYQVYEDFLEKIIYSDENSETHKELNPKNISEVHQHYALNLIMGNLYYLIDNYYSYQYDQNRIMDRMTDLEIMQKSFDDCKNSSLITFDADGRVFEFLHQTIAEFFVAQYFIENIYKAENVENQEMKKRIEIFIFILKNSNFEIVQNFIADFLMLQGDEKKFSKVVRDLMTTKFLNVALTFSENESPEILYKFFEGDKIISESLGSKFDWIKTNFAIYLGSKKNHKELKLDKIWQLYVRYNQRGKIFYQLWRKDEKIFNYLVKVVKVDEKIAKNVRKVGNFGEFHKFMIQNLTKTEQRELVLKYYPEIIGKFAIAENFDEFWKEIKKSELFSPSELTKIILEPNWKNDTIFSQALSSNSQDHKIISWIENLKNSSQFNSEDIFNGLKAQQKSTKETSLMIASYKKSVHVNSKLLNYVEDKLERNQLKNLLKLENSQNFTVLQVSTFNLDSNIFDIYKNFLKKHLSKHEMREVLLTKSTEVKLYLLETLMWRNLPQRDAMIKLIKEIFIDTRQNKLLREILSGRDENGHTIFSGNLENFEDEIQPLLKFGEIIFDKDEIEELKVRKDDEKFIYKKIKFGENVWPE